jgi:two-component system response regulator GlrR
MLRLLSIRLSASGYEVITAESGAQALAQLSVSRPQLVITDLRMDGMDGIALFDAIQQSNTALPVILLTAHGSIPDAIDATNRGVFSFLTKPCDGKTLLAHIQKALSLTGNGVPVQTEAGDEDWRQGIITRSSLMEDLLVQAKMVAASERRPRVECVLGNSPF